VAARITCTHLYMYHLLPRYLLCITIKIWIYVHEIVGSVLPTALAVRLIHVNNVVRGRMRYCTRAVPHHSSGRDPAVPGLGQGLSGVSS